MKVLHVQNCAAVPYTIAKELARRGHTASVQALVTANWFSYHPTWLHMVPDQKLVNIHFGRAGYPARVFAQIKDYDVIHVHIWDKIIWWLKVHFQKPFVLTYHGYDIRDKWKYHRYWEVADKVTVATKDLLEGAPPQVEYVPNPVDPEFFKYRMDPVEGLCLYNSWLGVQHKADKEAKRIAKEYDLQLVSLPRKGISYPYLTMPWYLSMFSHLIDVKLDPVTSKLFEVHSLLGLQARAMGLKVYNQGEWKEGLPEEHHVEKVVDRWLEIYQEAIDKKNKEW